MKSDDICVVTSPDDSILVADAQKTEENPCIIWKTVGIFGHEEVVGGRRLFCFTDDNVRSDIALLQNEDPIFENSS